MNKILTLLLFLTLSIFGKAQMHRNMNGSPDMRYKENKIIYGSPSPSYNNSSTELPSRNSRNYNYPTPSSKTPTYTNPYSGERSSLPSYPTKKNGTPDMRYKENRGF